MTITVQYSDEDVARVDESMLTLYIWNDNQWIDAVPCGGYVRDLDGNTLKATICHFSDYALLGKTAYRVYLPVILRSTSQGD